MVFPVDGVRTNIVIPSPRESAVFCSELTPKRSTLFTTLPVLALRTNRPVPPGVATLTLSVPRFPPAFEAPRRVRGPGAHRLKRATTWHDNVECRSCAAADLADVGIPGRRQRAGLPRGDKYAADRRVIVRRLCDSGSIQSPPRRRTTTGEIELPRRATGECNDLIRQHRAAETRIEHAAVDIHSAGDGVICGQDQRSAAGFYQTCGAGQHVADRYTFAVAQRTHGDRRRRAGQGDRVAAERPTGRRIHDFGIAENQVADRCADRPR